MTDKTSGLPLVFLDTSVLVAAVLSSTGPANAVCLLGQKEVVEILISESVHLELQDVVQRKFRDIEIRFAEFVRDLAPTMTPAPTAAQILAWEGYIETRDCHVLAAAHAAKVKYLVTHDVNDFKTKKLSEMVKFQILTPGELLGHLGRLRK